MVRLLPVVALLARKALQVVDVALSSHHHLESGDHLRARRAVAGRAEQPASTKINPSYLETL